jgi:hypothetical protein
MIQNNLREGIHGDHSLTEAAGGRRLMIFILL